MLAQFLKPGKDFQSGLKPSQCYYHVHFKRISFRRRAKISALVEIRHVMTPVFGPRSIVAMELKREREHVQ